MYVVDASVYVADARPQERHHAEAHAFLSRVVAQSWVVHLPVIALAEVASAISRGMGQPTLALELVAALRRVPQFEFVSVDEDLANHAAALAARCRLRGCDAVYVALARVRSVSLITLDREQKARVPPDVRAFTPGEELARLG